MNLILQSMPPLGFWGWLVLLLLFIASGILHLVQRRKINATEISKEEVQQAQNETSHWKGTAGAYEKELVVVRDRCDRLEGEAKNHLQMIGELQAKTDIKPLMEIQERIVASLNELSVGNAERYAKVTELMSANTEAVGALGRHLSREFTQHRKALNKWVTAFEKRMGEQA